MRKFLTFMVVVVFTTLLTTLASCENEPEVSEVQVQTIEKGQSIHASVGSLVFYVCNDFPEIYTVPGMSNYTNAPTISFVGVVDSLDEISLDKATQWNEKSEIINNGGYIARVRYYDPTSRGDKSGYLFMFVEIIQETQSDINSFVNQGKIRVTFKLQQKF